MKKIIIKTIPDSHQRYNTVGDYYTDEDGNRIFAVSDMNNWKYEFLVAVHELIEAALCQDRGITDDAIDAFDLAFEEKRLLDPNIGEPGDREEAPYYKEHQFATKIEKMLAEELGVSWDTYTEICATLDRNKEVIRPETTNS
jgi:hypothetical protein